MTPTDMEILCGSIFGCTVGLLIGFCIGRLMLQVLLSSPPGFVGTRDAAPHSFHPPPTDAGAAPLPDASTWLRRPEEIQ